MKAIIEEELHPEELDGTSPRKFFIDVAPMDPDDFIERLKKEFAKKNPTPAAHDDDYWIPFKGSV